MCLTLSIKDQKVLHFRPSYLSQIRPLHSFSATLGNLWPDCTTLSIGLLVPDTSVIAITHSPMDDKMDLILVSVFKLNVQI